jgi:sulfite reductase beta subunit-like hemoprotein
MSALKQERRITKDINLVYDMTEKPNLTNLTAHEDRAVIAKFRADLVLPTNKILTVDIDFDTTSGYHNNAIMIMDDFGVEMLATAFETKYGKAHADKVRKAWAEKEDKDDPRKPTYMLVQKPKDDTELPQVFVACGKSDHKDNTPICIL